MHWISFIKSQEKVKMVSFKIFTSFIFAHAFKYVYAKENSQYTNAKIIPMMHHSSIVNAPAANKLRGATAIQDSNRYLDDISADQDPIHYIDLTQIASSLSTPDDSAPSSLSVQFFLDDEPIVFDRLLDSNDNDSRYWYGESKTNDNFNIEVKQGKQCTGYVLYW